MGQGGQGRLGIPKRARAAAATAGQGLKVVAVECLKVAQRVRVPLWSMGIHGSVDSGSGFGWFGKAALTALGTPPLAGILFYFVFF